jgi:predicted transcriptional regulator
MNKLSEKEFAIRYLLKNPYLDREMALSDKGYEIYKNFSHGEFLDADVSNHFGITIQHAHAVLSSIVKKGYLKRIKIPSPSGGIQWKYHIL